MAYDSDCTEYLKILYDDYVLKGARTPPLVRFPDCGIGVQAAEPIPMRGRKFVPRREYVRAQRSVPSQNGD